MENGNSPFFRPKHIGLSSLLDPPPPSAYPLAMIRRTMSRLWARRRTWALLALAGAFVAVNALAFLHARALTHYVAAEDETEDAEDLSWEEMARVLFTGATVKRPEIKRKPAFWTWYETHTFPSTGGVQLEAWHVPYDGSPAIVAMFHGYGTSKSSLLDEARGFRALGYSTLLVDLRASGGSTGSVTTLGYHEADDVAAGVAYARKLEPGKPVVLYGSSMGAVAALRAMGALEVEPAAAVLECPFDTLLSTVGNRFRLMHVPAFPLAQLVVFWGGLQLGYNGFAHDATAYAAKVDTPVLLIGGGDDPRVTVDQLKKVYARLAGPKRLEIFEGAGHGGYIDDDGRRWRRAVSEFIEAGLAERKGESAHGNAAPESVSGSAAG